jgi:DNA (cytosine-5)-methyltransferase 1
LNGLALFAGVGGLEIGVNLILPESRTVCYVEGETYNVEVLQNKIEKKQLEEAIIFSDVQSFGSVCHLFSGKVDFITGGFPCQPFSGAGSRKGIKDERWLWDSILEIISQVRPSFLFLENVSNLLNEWGAFDEISKSLAKVGFCLEWGTLRASEIGANHHRNRLFIFGYKPESIDYIKPIVPYANPNGKRRNELDYAKESIEEKGQSNYSYNKTGNVADSYSNGTRENVNGFTLAESGNQRRSTFSRYGINHPSWWQNEPRICRVVDGVAFGMDRIRACGNGVVPLQAAMAYYTLINRAKSNFEVKS